MKNYEMIFIVHPNVSEEETPKVADKVVSIISQHKGEVIALKKWGKRKFAHKIKKCTRGHFFLLYFMATPAIMAELERVLRYDENILRYQTVRSKKEEVETIRREMEDQNQEEEKPLPPPENKREDKDH